MSDDTPVPIARPKPKSTAQPQAKPGHEAERRRIVREKRSAEALRLNLQRRKATAKPGSQDGPASS